MTKIFKTNFFWKIFIIIIFIYNCNYLFAQGHQCYNVDWQKMIVHCKNDSTKLFSGECISFHKNGKLESKSLVKNGVILYAMLWKKNGTLLDSIISLDSLGKNMVHFDYYKNGKLFLLQMLNRETTAAVDIYYNKKGIKIGEVNYFNWVRNGLTILYNKLGSKISEENYKDNILVNPVIEWKKGIKYEVQYKVKVRNIFSRTYEVMTEISRNRLE